MIMGSRAERLKREQPQEENGPDKLSLEYRAKGRSAEDPLPALNTLMLLNTCFPF